MSSECFSEERRLREFTEALEGELLSRKSGFQQVLEANPSIATHEGIRLVRIEIEKLENLVNRNRKLLGKP
jgi:hypothetical protein